MPRVDVCSVCGKTMTTGKIIYEGRIYCQECFNKMDRLIKTFHLQIMEAIIYDKELPNVDEFVNKHREFFKKYGMDVVHVKYMCLLPIFRMIVDVKLKKMFSEENRRIL